MNKARSSRRALLIKAGQAVVAASLPLSQINGAINWKKKQHTFSGIINHSVCSWTYGFLTLSELCVVAQQLGIPAIDLVAPKDFTILKEHRINCSMCYTGGKVSLTQGWNNTANHPWLIKDYQEAIPIVAKAGYKNLICFSGNRDGMDNDTGLAKLHKKVFNKSCPSQRSME